MIEVIYNRRDRRVIVSGHAMSAEPGHDLVCSAASILACTLVNAVENLAQNKKQIKSYKVQLDPGKARIWIAPAREYSAPVTLVMDSICAGFELLAANHPDYISYELRG